jgi:thiol:disulfide interchange protein
MKRLCLIVTLAIASVAVAQDTPAPEVARPYDEHADATAEIDGAVRVAHRQNKRVLLVFGANWCVWCRRLAYTLEHDPQVVAALAHSFVVVHVDTGARGSGRAAQLDARYGHPTQAGLPAIAVLDGDGHLVTTQDTGALERGDRHDPQAILAFLSRVSPPHP